MTEKDKGHYRDKHPAGKRPEARIVEALKGRVSQGEIPCAVAFAVVEELKAAPAEVGFAMDSLEAKLSKCQLGLFGYGAKKKAVKPAPSVPTELGQVIQKAVKAGRISCSDAWEIARRFGIPKMEVSAACETLKIKVTPCQLGAF